ncbi:MAG: DUF3108 domain-containing protein [Thermodesulfobacteriota bacterium]
MFRNIRWLPLLVALFHAGLFPGDARADRPIETLTYQVRWSFVPAGEVVLERLPDADIEGAPARHYRLTARTLPYVDLFYRVRDTMDSYTDPSLSRSLLYRKIQKEGRIDRDVTVRFDWREMTATYADHGIVLAPVQLTADTLDPLAACFYLQQAGLSPGETLVRPISDGKKVVLGRATALRREKVAVPLGRFPALVVEPGLGDVGGVFEKSRNARMLLWFMEGDDPLLLRVESEVVVGSFVVELVRRDRGAVP